ncbi:aspartic proteinase [Grosmannia clavigera kw1407]|uniref:Aspartic proteinase n=1 Tax=Grosmannia clavigera (strain kw1407 / UAMH 11150) TaxID=655863 RepID=F0XCI9_GROCL|nr:aspartic proteinase [Grosmannia clavigera kw1407]EFX03838.1 aspartic proteinase [Grosmannia clavigera kw1407]
MPSTTFLTVALAAVSAVSAMPARIGVPVSTSNFSIHQVRNEQFTGHHGPLALAKAYRKYGVALPTDLEAAVAKIQADQAVSRRDTGSATNTPTSDDSEYLTPVQIGTPAQTLHLDFDTGSSDLWVFSTETPSGSVDGQTLYKPASSSSSEKLTGATWKIKYGDDSTSSGDVYTDVVSVGGLSVQSQAVESAKTVSSSFTSDTASSGLLGLAFSSINAVLPDQQNTFFDNAQDSLDSALFTVDLKHGKAGKYNFGYIDSAAHTGSITYTDVDNAKGFWGFTADGYKIGNAAKKGTSISGIADTGTTLLLLPDAVVDAYYAGVSGASYDSSQGGYTFPSSATLPAFTYYVEGVAFTVPASYIKYAAIDSSTYFGGIQSDSSIGFSIFGDVALKAAFVIFDATPKLGFAPKTL